MTFSVIQCFEIIVKAGKYKTSFLIKFQHALRLRIHTFEYILISVSQTRENTKINSNGWSGSSIGRSTINFHIQMDDSTRANFEPKHWIEEISGNIAPWFMLSHTYMGVLNFGILECLRLCRHSESAIRWMRAPSLLHGSVALRSLISIHYVRWHESFGFDHFYVKT